MTSKLFDVVSEYLCEREIVEATNTNHTTKSNKTNTLLTTILNNTLTN